MTDRKRFSVNRNPVKFGIDIYAFRERLDTIAIYELKETEEVEKGNPVNKEPTIFIGNEEAQELFNELWREGFRPEKSDPESMKAHLNDMRSIVQKLLDVKL